jgi:hypothetical protein
MNSASKDLFLLGCGFAARWISGVHMLFMRKPGRKGLSRNRAQSSDCSSVCNHAREYAHHRFAVALEMASVSAASSIVSPMK